MHKTLPFVLFSQVLSACTLQLCSSTMKHAQHANGSYSQLTVFVVGVGCFLAGALEFEIAASRSG